MLSNDTGCTLKGEESEQLLLFWRFCVILGVRIARGMGVPQGRQSQQLGCKVRVGKIKEFVSFFKQVAHR